ncbi:MAG: terminase large subunit [Synergistaceae bacterium]|nr:terminase large subunit [Synergistaceae bacterium]MBR0254057.1 terminase large subunit [Synergistaceae bacterium]
MNYIGEYLSDIKAGRIVTSKRVIELYQRLEHEIENPTRYHFDERKASRPIEFIERFCRHSKGEFAGRPFELLPFQKAFISALFGFVDERGKRRFREAFFYMARKNGKSALLSAIALYCLIADGEAGAEVYSVATKKEQARLIFDEALNMIKQSPELSKILKKRKTDIYCEKTFSKFQALGKNFDTLDGLNASLVIIDECHAIKDRELYEVMKQSQSARSQPLLITITTAGTVRESIFDSLYSYSCDIVDGKITDDTFLPVMYELDGKEEYKNPSMWVKANPAIGKLKSISDLTVKVKRAENSPADLNGLLCKDFNVISNVNSAWLSWEAINNTEIFDIDKFKECYAIGGVDLSLTTDLTCATLLLMDNTEKRYVVQQYWLPESTYNDRMNDKIPYDKWHEQGLLRLCNGNTINPSDVAKWFVEMYKERQIIPLYIYYDSYSARYFVDEMEGYGFNMVRCIQGAKTLSQPLERLGADLTAKKINYNNNPLLKWCLCNTCITEDRNGNILPVKRRNHIYRIDGLASLLDAYCGLLDHFAELKNLCKE